MPIEFRCPGCNKLLRTADTAAGHQSKCPHCGAPITVPMTSQTAPSAAPQQPPSLGTPAPAPSSYTPGWNLPAAEHAAATGQLQAHPLEIGEVLRNSWAIFKRNWGVCIGAFVLVFIVSALINGIAMGVGFAMGGRNAGGAGSGLQMIVQIIAAIVGIWLQAGIILLMLKVARGDPSATVNDVFAGATWIVSFAVASLLFSLIVGLGFVLLIVPGIILALMLWPFQYLIVDRNMGAIDSLSEARNITRGNKLTVLGLWIVMFLIAIPVLILTLGIGMIVYGPFAALVIAVTYLAMTGQPIAVEPQAG